VLTFKKSDELRAIARDVPIDRLLVETDAPFLAPLPHRGKRNEPALVVETAKVLAEVKGLSAAALATTTSANTLRLFSKMSAPRVAP
ncbi:MAG: TatD family hydrolase, partial [Methylovirgula sp.]